MKKTSLLFTLLFSDFVAKPVVVSPTPSESFSSNSSGSIISKEFPGTAGRQTNSEMFDSKPDRRLLRHVDRLLFEILVLFQAQQSGKTSELAMEKYLETTDKLNLELRFFQSIEFKAKAFKNVLAVLKLVFNLSRIDSLFLNCWAELDHIVHVFFMELLFPQCCTENLIILNTKQSLAIKEAFYCLMTDSESPDHWHLLSLAINRYAKIHGKCSPIFADCLDEIFCSETS